MGPVRPARPPGRAERNRSEGRQRGHLAVARAADSRRFDDPFSGQTPGAWRMLERVVDAAGRQVLDDQVIGATDEGDRGGDPVARADVQLELLLEPVARQDLEPGERPGPAVPAVGVRSDLLEGRPARTRLAVEADPDRERRVAAGRAGQARLGPPALDAAECLAGAGHVARPVRRGSVEGPLAGRRPIVHLGHRAAGVEGNRRGFGRGRRRRPGRRRTSSYPAAGRTDERGGSEAVVPSAIGPGGWERSRARSTPTPNDAINATDRSRRERGLGRRRSVSEMAHPREDHRSPRPVGSGDDLRVAQRAARLDERADPGRQAGLDSIRKREVGIGGAGGAHGGRWPPRSPGPCPPPAGRRRPGWSGPNRGRSGGDRGPARSRCSSRPARAARRGPGPAPRQPSGNGSSPRASRPGRRGRRRGW